MTASNVLGNKIITGRITIALTQKEFAQKLGIGVRTLRRYEKGETIPDALTWIKIEHLLKNAYYMGNENIRFAKPRLHPVNAIANQIDKGNTVLIYGSMYEYYVLLEKTAYVGDLQVFGKQILTNTNIKAIHIEGRCFNNT